MYCLSLVTWELKLDKLKLIEKLTEIILTFQNATKYSSFFSIYNIPVIIKKVIFYMIGNDNEIHFFISYSCTHGRCYKPYFLKCWQELTGWLCGTTYSLTIHPLCCISWWHTLLIPGKLSSAHDPKTTLRFFWTFKNLKIK